MSNAPTLFPYLEKVRREAMALLIEARNFAAVTRERPRDGSDNLRRLIISGETMRLVSRLVSIMAWLMERKAAEPDATVPFESAVDGETLMYNPVCLDNRRDDDQSLPPELRSLLKRSHSLYVRIARIDGMMRRGLPVPAGGAADGAAADGAAPGATSALH